MKGNILGRKKTIVVGQVVTIIGAALQASSHGLAQMIVARVVTGFGVGHLTSTVTVWSVSFAGRPQFLDPLSDVGSG